MIGKTKAGSDDCEARDLTVAPNRGIMEVENQRRAIMPQIFDDRIKKLSQVLTFSDLLSLDVDPPLSISDKCLISSKVLWSPLADTNKEWRKERRMGDQKGWIFTVFPEIFTKQLHIVGQETSDEDILSIFGEMPERLERIQDNWMMAHLLVADDWFPSLSEAKRNGGWQKEPIPQGFSCWINSQRNRCMWIWNSEDISEKS